jgi:ABC-type amino acid transport substrate-binding protein
MLLATARRLFYPFIFVLVMCQVTLAQADAVLDRVVKKGVLRVAMSVDQPPYNMRNKDDEIVGFDVDLAKALAKVMQVRLEIVEMPFSELLSSIPAGKADMAISGLTITPERTRKVSFVGPYLLSGKSIITTERIKKVVQSGADFNDPEIRVVALEGSTSEIFAQRQLPDASFLSIANYNDGIEMLLTGGVDAMVADIPILKLIKLRYSEAALGILEPQLSVEPLGIAISRKDPQFENLLRNYLHGMDQAGLIPRLRKKWFEDNSWIETLP